MTEPVNSASETTGFRGARRVQGYIEPTAIPPRPPAPSGGEAPPPASEQLLAQLGSDDPPDAAEPAAEVNEDTPREPVLTFETRLRARERGAQTPSRGMRGFLRRLGLKLGPSSAEKHAAEMGSARALIRLSSWPRSAGVLVANPKGGVGKTPLSLSIGGIFAHNRGGGTIVLEVSDDAGALSVRAEGTGAVGIAELLRDIDQITGAGQLAGYVSQQTSYAGVIGTVADRAALTGDDVRAMAALTDTYYPVRVMDSGNQPTSSAFRGALDVTDVLVIPVLDAMPDWQGAMQLLRHLHQLGGHAAELARRAIVVRMHDSRPEDADVVAYGDQLIDNAGIQHVFHVPFDPHIADRTTLTLEKLRPATTDAITLLTAAIVQQLNSVVRKAA